MDYDAMTGEVYVPDIQHSLLAVLTPVGVGKNVPPHEPSRVIHVSAALQSIAITSDGQLGFVALANGTIDMLDIPGRQVASTFQVGGSPHFIITGLYPSMFSLTPQQASILSIVSNLSHYLAIIIIVISFIIIVLRAWLKRPR